MTAPKLVKPPAVEAGTIGIAKAAGGEAMTDPKSRRFVVAGGGKTGMASAAGGSAKTVPNVKPTSGS